MFREKIKIIQKIMNNKLSEIRTSFRNSTDKGENAEEILSSFIHDYIPPVYRIGRGEIIDSFGNQSKQIDIIITNQYHPFISDYIRPSTFFIEGVACCGEVKMSLTNTHLVEGLNNCKSLKKIIPKHIKGMQISATKSDIKRYLDRKPYFLFAYNSELKIETVLERTLNFNKQCSETEQIDAIFLLDKGSIINFGDGHGLLKFGKIINKESVSGYHISNRNSESVLYDFLTWLSVSIQNPIIYQSILINYIDNED